MAPLRQTLLASAACAAVALSGCVGPGWDGSATPGSDLVWADDDVATDDDDSATDPGDDDDATDPPPEDDALLLSYDFPASLGCGEEAAAYVTVRNTGTATWTRADSFKLGAVDDSDPLHPGDARIWLAEEDAVAPGAEHTFTISLLAGEEAGVFTSDWRMVHEAVGWFGDVASADVAVECEETGYPLPLPDMSSTVDAVAAAHPDLLADSCQDEGGTWGFMDALVDELRLVDERWGYNWKRGVVGDPSQDVVDYHFGPGISEGSQDVYIIDVIVGHCGPSPGPGWIDQTQATADAGTIGIWTGRGRF